MANTLLPYRDPTPGWVDTRAEDIVQMAKDAARWRWLRDELDAGTFNIDHLYAYGSDEWDALIDAEMDKKQ